jgi:hypothetical protein
LKATSAIAAAFGFVCALFGASNAAEPVEPS